ANVRQTALGSGELVERRFVDVESGRPVFKSRSRTLTTDRTQPLPPLDEYDLVLIADFGPGLLEPTAINRLVAERRSALVAVMVQVNSGNYGYNLPLKYCGADYYSLNRTEAELCLRERGLPVDELATRSAHLLESDRLSVTDGDRGVVVVGRAERATLP